MVGFFLIISGINASNGLAALVLLLLYAILVYSLIAVCWFMRAFAEITESVKATNKALQLTFERNIADAEENHRKEAEERAAAAKAEEEKLEAEIAAAEAARKKRFDDYWESHQEEAKALIAKKKEVWRNVPQLLSHACLCAGRLDAYSHFLSSGSWNRNALWHNFFSCRMLVVVTCRAAERSESAPV